MTSYTAWLRREKGYNLRMPRAALLITLLAASVLSGSLQAQRTGAHGNAAGQRIRSGIVGWRGSSNRFLAIRSHFHRNGVGAFFDSYFLPYDEPSESGQPDAETATEGPAGPVVIPRTPEPRVPKAQVIEIPGVANPNAKMLPPTIFILANGGRLETRRFLLTASNLSFSLDRRQRTIPLDMVDLDATIAANHERGIDLRIPADRNEISLSF